MCICKLPIETTPKEWVAKEDQESGWPERPTLVWALDACLAAATLASICALTAELIDFTNGQKTQTYIPVE